MVAAIFIAIIGPIIGISRTFSQLAEHESVNPSDIAAGISRSLAIAAVCIPIAIVAFVVRSWAQMRLRRDGFE